MSDFPPINYDLFRFTTLRMPQQLTNERKQAGFIFHPGESASIFLGGVPSGADQDKVRSLLLAKRATFRPMTSYLEVRALGTQVYDFSLWLSGNRGTITDANVAPKISGLIAISKSTLIQIWDNLFFYTLRPDNDYVRQACIQMIVASNFITRYNDPNKATLASETIQTPRLPDPPTASERLDLYVRRLASAKVVVPRYFAGPRKAPTVPNSEWSGRDREMESRMEKFLVNDELENLKNFRQDLRDYERIYYRERQEDYKQTRKIHKDAIGKAFAKEAKAAIQNTTLPAEAEIPFDEPPFRFSYPKAFDPKHYDNLLSDEAKVWMDELELGNLDFRKAKSIISRKIKRLAKKSNKRMGGKRKVVFVGDRPLKTRRPKLYCAVLTARKRRGKNNGIGVFMLINVGYERAFFKSATYSIGNLKDPNPTTSTEIAVVNNESRYLLVHLFDDVQEVPFKDRLFNFSGTFELNNGVSFTLNIVSSKDMRFHGGCGKPVTNPPDSSGFNTYGVHNVGIMDFRRVEQEVCCYVAGEVSHIENIMAREYKERHTRRLTSTEVTTETVAELEVENLSDTTTTNRNEMQSEVGEVVDKNKSLSTGASAGVSASYMGAEISAGMYLDFASSTSSSQSNSTARTYAEDITRQVQERVLEKMTKKRISRILKEYEENNRHGFDNREGTDHVTGIYRWVDKIYTNKLVNYGKRLMYEFMVPQPAKWYLYALEAEVEQHDEIPTLEVPRTPEEIGMVSPSYLNESNYLGFASEYSVHVDGPIPESRLKSESLTPTTTINHPTPFSHSFDILVPDGYEASKATGTMTWSWKDNRPNASRANFVVNI